MKANRTRAAALTLVLVGMLGGCVGQAGVPLQTTGEEPAVDNSSEPAVDSDPSGDAETQDVEEGTGRTLRVGIPVNYPGIGLMDDETGIPSGVDVDIAAYLAWKLGYSPYDIEWVPAPAAARMDLLTNAEVDFMVAPMSITPERLAEVEFAGPYLVSGQDLLVRASDQSIQGVEDLNGKTLCLLETTTGDARLRELYGDDVTIVYDDTYTDCIQRIVDGEVDATSTDDAILAGFASTDDFYRLVRIVGKPFSEERYGIGLPPDSHSLCLHINQALNEMVEDGSWKKFIDRHVAGTYYFENRYDNPPALETCK